MENGNDIPNKQICVIRIMLEVDSDEEALKLKTHVSRAVGTDKAKIDFSLTNKPMRNPVIG